jgi:hypothetical protein
MTRWPRALMEAIWTDEPTAREATLVAAFVLLVPFGWLVFVVRPILRRAFNGSRARGSRCR